MIEHEGYTILYCVYLSMYRSILDARQGLRGPEIKGR